jgi:hypothetical protein
MGTGHYAACFMHYPLLKHVKPNERVEVKRDKPVRIPVPHLSDEVALQLIRDVRIGRMKRKDAAEKYGVKIGTVNNLVDGINRVHLLRQVEEGQSEPTFFRFRQRGGRGHLK